MFTVSNTEFPDLNEFVSKLKASSHEKPDFDAIRDWCAERGFLLHFSKPTVAAAAVAAAVAVAATADAGELFYTLKYDRAKLTVDHYETTGRLRSVVFDREGNICCVAPCKMLTLTDEMKTTSVNSIDGVLVAEELVEGIMVNLFWKGGKWYVATKSCVGEVSFDHIIEAEAEQQVSAVETGDNTYTSYSSSHGFQKLSVQEILRRRICEVLSLLPGGLDPLPKEYCYSLIIQHPKNQIVNTITVPKLYLIAVYQLTRVDRDTDDKTAGVNVMRLNRDIFSANFGGSVSHMPHTLTCVPHSTEDDAVTATATTNTVDDYCAMYASADTKSVSLPGVVFVDKDTGVCYKKRNPKYELVKKRKGMEQKLMAQYLQLRKDHGIDEYLKYHPQHSRAFRQFRDRLHDYTQRLYDAYIEHYIKKDAKPLKEYDRELKTHMYKLHYDTYLATMKEAGAFITKHTVINYVNQLAAAQQLACLNATPSVSGTTSTSTATERGDDGRQEYKKQIVRANPRNGGGRSGNEPDAKFGFRSARPSRGGRMNPSLSVYVPYTDAEASTSTTNDRTQGAKSTGNVKVHNQFAGLDVD
jgi:hypothetical protein